MGSGGGGGERSGGGGGEGLSTQTHKGHTPHVTGPRGVKAEGKNFEIRQDVIRLKRW